MSVTVPALTLACHAKVNLVLRVLGLRPDGYHEVDMLLQSVGLADLLTIGGRSEGHSLTVEGLPAPKDRSNLCVRAVEALERRLGEAIGLDIHLRKRIPSAAGLGGGSADAAGVLVGANRLLGLGLSEQELLEVAAEVGSDVPAMVLGGTLLVGGRGERCRRVRPIGPLEIVIAQPPHGLSTPEVYRWWDLEGSTSPTSAEEVAGRLGNGEGALPVELMVNDLEPPVLGRVPEVRELKATLLRLGARHALLCGSGSAVAGLFHDRESAQAATDALAAELPFACHCRTHGCGVE